MKNDMKKRVLAGSMALVVGGAGFAGAYGYNSNTDEVKAADKEKEETEVLKETAEDALGDSSESSEKDTKGMFKEESVYVKTDPAGTVKETTVTEWLKNPGNGNVEDESSLGDIKNVKGEETFSQKSGSGLQWSAQGEDIYYQGSSSEKLPVEVSVSYKLDGKTISAKELNGKSGKVEITIDYSNHSKEKVKVGKKDEELYTPFTMVTAMMLSTDEYTNVEVDNGKVISDGDKNIVLGIGLPGLSENLKLEETDLDIEIPESVKITADVKNASVGPTVTMASTELMNEFGMDDIDSFDDLNDSLDELEDAAEKLKDGSKDAADGAKKLADGSKELKDGTKNLKSGTKDLKGGTKELKDGTSDLADGSKQVADGLSTLNAKSGDLIKGVNSLAEGVNTYTTTIGQIAANTGALKSGAEKVSIGVNDLCDKVTAMSGGASGANSQADKTTQQLNAVEKALDKVDADVEYTGDTKGKVVATKSASQIASESVGSVSINVDLSGIPEEYRGEVKDAIEKAEHEANEKLKSQAEKVAEKALDSTKVEITEERKAKAVVDKSQAEKALDSAQDKAAAMQEANVELKAGAADLVAQMETLKNGAKAVAEGIAKVDAGAQGLNENSGKLLKGTSDLKEGGAQLAGGVKQLDKGASAVADGAGKLKAGAGKLDSGAGKLDDGAGKLDNGTGTLADGANALADGTLELADGMSEFKEEGIDKLTETFDGDFQNVKDRLDAMSDMGKAYKSYAGIKKGMDGSTKFIIETEGIDED